MADEWDHRDEPMGTKEKRWIKLPGDDRLWLLKLAREKDGVVRGEDWAEWIVHHLATLLGLPSASIRPANWDGRRGIVSRAVHTPAEQLVLGNSLLFGRDASYNRDANRQNAGYTPHAVRDALDGVGVPPDLPLPLVMTGFDLWAGYLVLDAWTSGRDRHHENWGVVWSGRERWLAPSFDHGNALGFSESDQRYSQLVTDEQSWSKWQRRGTSHHFAGKPALVDVAAEALELASPSIAQHWLGQLSTVRFDTLQDIVEAVPMDILSAVGRTFVVRLLVENRRRLLDGY